MPPPLPFPYAIRVGTDIVRISRIARLLRGRHGARFVERVLAPDERARLRPAVQDAVARLETPPPPLFKTLGESAEGGGDGDDGTDVGEEGHHRLATYLAGRWAAKEAAIKAHPHLRLGFHDILILAGTEAKSGSGGGDGREDRDRRDSAPTALIKASQTDPAARDQMAVVSISHDSDYATAVCIGFDPGMASGVDQMKGS
ncbi:hypothetical protein VTK26DRAFT_2996 [Humicola hyalothermophila]